MANNNNKLTPIRKEEGKTERKIKRENDEINKYKNYQRNRQEEWSRLSEAYARDMGLQ